MASYHVVVPAQKSRSGNCSVHFQDEITHKFSVIPRTTKRWIKIKEKSWKKPAIPLFFIFCGWASKLPDVLAFFQLDEGMCQELVCIYTFALFVVFSLWLQLEF